MVQTPLPNTQQKKAPQKWFTRWWAIVLLIMLVMVLVVIVLFSQRTLEYYAQIRSGTVDLTAFSQTQNRSTSQTTQTVQVKQTQDISSSAVSNFANDPKIGAENSTLTVVAFEDFQCPYCLETFPAFRRIIEKYKDRVLFVYRDFPLTDIHPQAQQAAEAAQCAHEQGSFWQYHDTLFTNQERLSTDDLKRYAQQLGLNTIAFDSCVDSGKYTDEVTADFDDGLQAGVSGTPTFFFNGNKVEGVITEEGFEQIIHYFIEE